METMHYRSYKSDFRKYIYSNYSGKVRTVKDVENILKAGGDKVLLNSGVVKNKKILKEVVKNYGSSNVAVNIDVKLS